jgi:outer membrane protein, heavy metal efflux system
MRILQRKMPWLGCVVLLALGQMSVAIRAQLPVATDGSTSALVRYVDQADGLTADEAVNYALSHNAELLAARKDIEAAEALVKQAALRPNPQLNLEGSRRIIGKDNSISAIASLPLELGGRRAARIAVAQRELEMRRYDFANRERLLAAEVRMTFGEALAQTLRVALTEELLANSRDGYDLVAARVNAGATAPLEQNLVLVEVNRLRSQRENVAGKLEVLLLELRNLVGMPPEQPLRLRGDFNSLLDTLAPLALETERALRERPDLLAARTLETLATARVDQARAAGRLDADLMAGFGRMKSGFMVFGVNDHGQLQPVQGVSNSLKLGVSLNLPVRNRNQGAIEAAVVGTESARQRREFAELTARREVAVAYTRYESAARAMEIFRNGVRDQAKANLDVVRQTYELGSGTLLDYIAEQRRFIELETDFIEAQLATYSARIEIERATASPELIKK